MSPNFLFQETVKHGIFERSNLAIGQLLLSDGSSFVLSVLTVNLIFGHKRSVTKLTHEFVETYSIQLIRV